MIPLHLPLLTGSGFDLAAAGIAALLAWWGYRARTRTAIAVATVVGVSVASGVLLFGFLAYPILGWIVLRRRSAAVGWLLLLSAVGGTALVARRIPLPVLVAAGPTVPAAGIVTRVRERHAIWGTTRSQGQWVPRPFQEVTVSFPLRAGDTLQLTDRIDSGSVTPLRVGGRVTVDVPLGAPGLARLRGGGQAWAHDAFVAILELTWGIAGVVFVGGIVARLVGRRISAVIRGIAPPPPSRPLP